MNQPVSEGIATLNSTGSVPEGDVVARLSNVSKIYGKGSAQVVALHNVSLTFQAGEFVAIMGPSGSGKSTLLHCAAALDRVSSGHIEIAGRLVNNLSDKGLTKLRRQQIGFVFQAYNLIPILTAYENIVLPLRLTNIHRMDPTTRRLFDSLVSVLGIADRLKHLPGEMSGGQQQRVAVARAFVTQPALIFADEPTGNLDSKSSNDLLAFLKDANQTYQQTIVMVTHSAHSASFAQRVVFLKDGSVVDELHQPQTADITRRLDDLEK